MIPPVRRRCDEEVWRMAACHQSKDVRCNQESRYTRGQCSHGSRLL